MQESPDGLEGSWGWRIGGSGTQVWAFTERKDEQGGAEPHGKSAVYQYDLQDPTQHLPHDSPQQKGAGSEDSIITSLHTLPNDILEHIGFYLDLQSLIQLSRAARPLVTLADDRTFQDLCLYLGGPSLDNPEDYNDYYSGPRSWFQPEVQSVKYKGLKDKLESILRRADERRWTKVQSIKLRLQGGAADLAGQILRAASPYVQKLELEEGTYFASGIDFPSDETIDQTLFDAHLSFPSLTYVRLGAHSFAAGETCVLLCAAAPNLLDLDITFDLSPTRPALQVPHPALADPTRIRNLRFAWNGPDDERSAVDALVAVLTDSPNIQRLNLELEGASDQLLIMLVALVSANLPVLTDLHWPSNWLVFDGTSEDGLEDRIKVLENVRRLVIKCRKHATMLLGLCDMPLLEQLCIDCSALEEVRPRSEAWDSNSYPMPFALLEFFELLHLFPKLDLIHTFRDPIDMSDLSSFDRLEGARSLPSQSRGYIASLVHGDQEIVYARLLLEHRQVADYEDDDARSMFIDETRYVAEFYDDEAGVDRMGFFEKLPEPTWQVLIGHHDQGVLTIVPEDIIRRMREVAGLREEDWERRGVEVGAAAWAVYEEYWGGLADHTNDWDISEHKKRYS